MWPRAAGEEGLGNKARREAKGHLLDGKVLRVYNMWPRAAAPDGY